MGAPKAAQLRPNVIVYKMGGIVPVQQGLGNYLALDEDKSSATNTAFFIYVVIWRGTSEQ